MNIWEAYCNPSYYNVYFEFLKAKGIKPEEAENLKEQYCVYLQRIKGTIFGIDLEDITTKEVFLDRLKDIFYVKWAGKVKYQSMPAHYEHYLTFLDTMQVLHNDFINDKEEERLINLNINIPVKELTEYETQYLIDSKLVALANPQLLYILKRYIENHGIASKRLALVCKEFYGDLLPKMESEDYVRLISMLWTSSHQVKKGGGRNKIKITFPDGKVWLYSIYDAVVQVVDFYEFEKVFNWKPRMRDENFLLKHVPYGQDKMYREIRSGQYFRCNVSYKDHLNILRMINIHFGNKLKIELQ